MRRFFYIFAVIITIALQGCQKSPNDSMVGHFRVTDYKCDKPMDPEMEMIAQSITQSTFADHKADHTLIFTENGIPKKGTWELLGGDMQLKYVLEGNKVLINDIHEIGNSYFVLEIQEGPNSFTYITYTKD